MTNEIIYPELGETTAAQIEYTCAYGGKFYLTTALDIKGRGITPNGDGSNHARGLKTFYATEAAMSKLQIVYTTCYIASL